MEKDESVIPEGQYCYTRLGSDASIITGFKIKPCPYWSSRADKPEQENGHCSFLGYGDWESETLSLLWDSVKECGLNMGKFEDECDPSIT